MRVEYVASRDLPSLDFSSELDVVVAMPFTQINMAKQAAELMNDRSGLTRGLIVCVHDDDSAGFVQLTNQIFRVTRSQYFAYVAQDAFAGRDWLKKAIDAMQADKVLLGFNDGKWFGALAGFGLVRRSWAVKNYDGNLFFPDYSQHYSDAELTLLAMQQNVYVYDPDCLLVELDWNKDRKSVHALDRQLYLERLRLGIDGRVTRSALLTLFS